jgi:hypothetical protein
VVWLAKKVMTHWNLKKIVVITVEIMHWNTNIWYKPLINPYLMSLVSSAINLGLGAKLKRHMMGILTSAIGGKAWAGRHLSPSLSPYMEHAPWDGH